MQPPPPFYRILSEIEPIMVLELTIHCNTVSRALAATDRNDRNEFPIRDFVAWIALHDDRREFRLENVLGGPFVVVVGEGNRHPRKVTTISEKSCSFGFDRRTAIANVNSQPRRTSPSAGFGSSAAIAVQSSNSI